MQAIIAGQNAVSQKMVPTLMAFLIFAQGLCGSVFIIIANTIFTQTLTSTLPKYAPRVSIQDALQAGASASAIQHLVQNSRDQLDGVLKAYSESLGNIWYLLVGFSCAMFCVSFGMGWVDVREKKDEQADEKVESQVTTQNTGEEMHDV